ncbi:phenylalanine--tRNA ligase subunit beta [Patescibacteria group bacterium]|nr:phenylalanine--tRNA ligase subunit beta [Patescibacteria group bacterium]
MKISLDWLSDYIDITEKDHEKIKDIITANSAEIETMERQGDHLENVIVGKVIELKPHPNADRLTLCTVFDGEEKYKVVCGGSNLKDGMLVAYAKVGAVVRWHGSEVMKLEKVKLRGEESFGMICAGEEIGLDDMFPAKHEHEIVDLSSLDLKVGAPLAKALGLDDVVLDVDNHAITNRADLFSHRGFAREFVANNLGKWKKQKEFKMPTSGSPSPVTIDIKDKDVCSRYASVYMTGIEIAESPDWMKKRLSACGIRPISNMVDITNYIMLELGMPLHAFDVDQVKGKKWVMRKSKKGEKVITLDEQEHELMDGVIVLDDGHEIFDLCGIMGGYTSGINEKTEKILLHSPVYHPTLVRRAMRSLGHISDASIVYEKGVDTELALVGLERAVQLILELCPNAKVASKVTDIQNIKPEKREINLRTSQINRLVGTKIDDKKVEKILDDLGFSFTKSKDGHKVSIPSFRLGDVSREADLIEEIARIYGYDNIPSITPAMDISPISVNYRRELEKKARDKLVARGFDEIYTFAFLGPELLAKCLMEANSESIEVENPISADMSLMKQSLLPRMLETITDNLRYKNQFRLFELNPLYNKKGNSHEEKSALIATVIGEDFRTLQGIIDMGDIIPAKDNVAPHMHPGRTGEVVLRGQRVGYIYEVHPQVLKNFDIKSTVSVFELDIEALHNMDYDARPKYKEFSKFPAVQLDISVAIPKKDLAADYFKSIQAVDKTLISNVELIDEYTGEKISADKRALTYSITYQAKDRTLTEQEVDTIHKQVISKLKAKGAEIR